MRSPPYIYCYLGTLVQKNRKPCKDGNFARTRIRTAAFRLRYNTTDHGVLASFFFGASREKFKKCIDFGLLQPARAKGGLPQRGSAGNRISIGRTLPGAFQVVVREFEAGELVYAAGVRYLKKRMNIRTQILRSIPRPR